ncbi:MAG: YdeI/OmpD-associated family protein [Actinomycetota bacterium]|nr:YdeI/OmpD-associated family protein [Actinomycetota bacterium]
MTEPIFFDGPEGFREWLEANHERATEVSVGFYKKATGRQTMSWSQAVDQALCFGWIDGKLNRIDDERHRQRFTPRKPGSNWSRVNVEKMAKLEAGGLMTPAGRRAFEQRREDRTGVYSFEADEPAQLPAEYAERLSATARSYCERRPPWYRRASAHWVMSAKREETRVKRLNTLIECSEQGLDVPPLRRA